MDRLPKNAVKLIQQKVISVYCLFDFVFVLSSSGHYHVYAFSTLPI